MAARNGFLKPIVVAMGVLALAPAAQAQTRAETLRQLTGNNINTLDPSMPGATREAFGVSTSTYDRLVAFDRKLENGVWVFDRTKIRGELAESYQVSADGLTITFKLRDAKWHDGSPVTADDVKWSLDRAVSAKSLSAGQLGTGSLTKPEQFKVVDAKTFEVSLPKPDRLALANLATPLAPIINSKLAKKHATAEDAWAQEWMKTNTAGSGAYVIESFKPGEQIILRRNENWTGGREGRLPYFKRIIEQTIPEAATRANLIEKGDADIAIDLQAGDLPALQSRGKVKVDSTPQSNGFTMIAFNTRMPPFDNIKVRQAVAAALPYEAMFSAAIFKRGLPMFGASWSEVPNGTFPQPMPVKTDLEKAKRLLAEAGHGNGLKTTFTINVGSAAITEPMAVLMKEALAKVGIDMEIQKLPDAQMSTAVAEKKLAFFTEGSSAWLPTTDYFFRTFFSGEQRWNYSSWNNSTIADLTTQARYELDPEKYEEMSKRMIEEYLKELPLIMLWQANQDAVMTPKLDGYTYWFHRQVDFRDLARR
ncbi:ABC transporter substrate-binding protein [Bradyrhizobium sp. LHD-71]|uniref:ABC transporter substrate-binding protein n=1 Tax=Bradyrhizobium sp. LHD-71 TaxID=3072141 RepID=UPI00280C5A4F|nr:ABC transporter substrate-binding protein [Bradyrhizobium sp. LHD-71]MDQ8730741.1 ABC transporter substrate-binding protein [Bradyrhizobium sp. LHD-71]